MPTTNPRKTYTCSCGRTFTTSSGERNHGNACPIERARSAAFVNGLETGQDPHIAAAVAVQTAKRSAYYSTR